MTTTAVIEAVQTVKHFLPPIQMEIMGGACRGEEGEWFRDKFVALAEQIKAMPKTYDQDGMGDQAVAHLHYFKGNADWFITEKDMEPEQIQAFGLVDLGWGPELGYVSIVELQENGIELDLHWTPKTLEKCKMMRA